MGQDEITDWLREGGDRGEVTHALGMGQRTENAGNYRYEDVETRTQGGGGWTLGLQDILAINYS